jgi:hypothetical protein
MGGKGGLNILPQKKWNVYNWDNRIKVEKHEKIVREEIDRLERDKTHKRIDHKIKQIKSGETEKEEYVQEDYDRNKIFKEIMQRDSMLKRVDNDIMIEKMRVPMRSEEQLKMFDDVGAEKKIEEMQNSDITTLGKSLKNNLKPWYMKKKLEDFKPVFESDNSEETLLKKKYKKDKKEKKHKKQKKESKDDEMSLFVKAMQKERVKIIKEYTKSN